MYANTETLLSAFFLVFFDQDHDQFFNMLACRSNKTVFQVITYQINHVEFDHAQFRLYGPYDVIELADKLTSKTIIKNNM